MKHLITTSLACLTLSLPVFAMHTTYPSDHWWSPSRLYLGASGGYGNVSGAYRNDGQVTQGRAVLGLHATENQTASLGIEAGVQSGNDMRLDATPALIAAAGGSPIDATLKPIADFLITLVAPFSSNYPFVGFVKGGIAYRQLILTDIHSTRDGIRKVNPELQLGLGVTITPSTTVTAFYQGIYSGSTASLALNSSDDVTVGHIPTEQALMLGVEYSFGNHTTDAAPLLMDNQTMSNTRTEHPKSYAENRTAGQPEKMIQASEYAFKPVSFATKSKPATATHQPDRHALAAKIAAVTTKHPTTAAKIAVKSSQQKATTKVAKKATSKKKATHTTTAKIAAKATVSKKMAAKKSASKTVTHAAKKTHTKVAAQIKKQAPVKALASAAPKATTPKPETKPATTLPPSLAQTDIPNIDTPALDFELMSESTTSNDETKTRPETREVFV